MRGLPPSMDAADPGWARQDTVARALGRAALAVGLTTDVFRPRDSRPPIVAGNRVVRLHAAFTGPDERFARPPGYGNAVWYGLFDTAYTAPGDYLRQGDALWFIAAQPRLMPALCVRADRVATFVRPVTTRTVGPGGYGGVNLGDSQTLLRGWPVSILATERPARTEAALPGDAGLAVWSVLLPALSGIVLEPADLLVDDLGRRAIVASAELTTLGWRLVVHQAVP